MRRLIALTIAGIMVAGCAPQNEGTSHTTRLTTRHTTWNTPPTFQDETKLPALPSNGENLKSRFQAGEVLSEDEHNDARIVFMVEIANALRLNDFAPRYSEFNNAPTMGSLKYDDGSVLIVFSGGDPEENVIAFNFEYPDILGYIYVMPILESLLDYFDHSGNAEQIALNVLEDVLEHDIGFGVIDDIEYRVQKKSNGGFLISVVQGWDVK